MGLSAALAAREQILRDGSLFRGVHLIGVVLTCTAVIVPLGVYLFLIHPTWSMLYWLEPLDISAWHILWVGLGAPAAGALGYLLGALMCRGLSPRATLVASGLGLAGLVASLVMVGDRLAHLTDDTAWQEAPSVLSGNLTAVFAFALPVILGAWMFLVLLYGVEGRKLQRASGVRLAAGAELAAEQVGPGPGECLSMISESRLSIPDLRSLAEMASSPGSDQQASEAEGPGDGQDHDAKPRPGPKTSDTANADQSGSEVAGPKKKP